MKPVFSNTFNITHSQNRSEFVLNFAHIYAEHKFVQEKGKFTDVSAQVADDVASILITREGAVALTKALYKIVSDWGVDFDN